MIDTFRVNKLEPCPNVEINNLKQHLAALQSVDLSQFEPESYQFDETGGKTSSLTIGT